MMMIFGYLICMHLPCVGPVIFANCDKCELYNGGTLSPKLSVARDNLQNKLLAHRPIVHSNCIVR